jgi:hypothetical protein
MRENLRQAIWSFDEDGADHDRLETPYANQGGTRTAWQLAERHRAPPQGRADNDLDRQR